jgi:hypothetical protein
LAEPFPEVDAVFRATSKNFATCSCYFVGMKLCNTYAKFLIWRQVAGVRTKICEVGNFFYDPLVYQKYRFRIWDVSFPSNRVRMSVDVYTGGNWVNLYTYADTDPTMLFGVTGRIGFGAFNEAGGMVEAFVDNVTVAKRAV